MDGGQWLTVQEFATAAGVSDKAIYSRLNGDLKPYLKTDKKRKYVNSAALDSVNFQSVESRKNQEDSNRINLIQEIERLKAERDKLRHDLHALEISAAVSAAERDAARQHELEQAQTIKALTAALSAAQSLHAGTIRGQLEQAAQRQDDALAKRDAVTADVVKHDTPAKHTERKKAHGVVKRPPINPDKVHGDSPKKKKPGILSRLWRHK